MKRLLIVSLMGLVLAGCDSADKHISITEKYGDNKGQTVIVDVSHFPDYVSVAGRRLYPDSQLPVSGANTQIADYEFTKQVKGKGDDFSTTFYRVNIMRCESDCILHAFDWMNQKDGGSTEWRTFRGKINYAQYSIFNSADFGNSKAGAFISGEVKGWD